MRTFRFFTWFLFICLFFPVAVSALDCEATVTPLGMPTNGGGISIQISVTNHGDAPIQMIDITGPFEDSVIYSPGTLSGWSMEVSDTNVNYSGGELLSGQTASTTWTASTSNASEQSGDWTIDASDFGEDGTLGCSGNLTAYLSASVDLSGPAFSNVGVTLLSTTSVRVDWVTDDEADSLVEYGTSSGSYTGNVADGTMATNHSLTITGLSSGSTYFVRAKSTDDNGNSGYSGEYSFTMPTPNQTITTETTITVTETIKAPEITKIVILRDTTPPGVVMTTKLDGVYDEAPTITGKAQDAEGVMRVQYSTDEGRNWLPVDDFSGEGRSSALFSFTPIGLLDGNYEVKVRAFDPAGNVGSSKTQTLVIDRLPPRVGATLLSVGAQPLSTTIEGSIYGLANIDHTFVASAVGGAIQIDLVADPFSFPLSFNSETGLWSGVLRFTTPGTYRLVAKAIDGAGNKTERLLQSMEILPSGSVYGGDSSKGIENGLISVYTLNPNTQEYVLWESEAFGQQNPQKTQANGDYSLLLPPGSYYLEIVSQGFFVGRTPIFRLNSSTPLHTDFRLEERKMLSLFGTSFYWPTNYKTILPVTIYTPTGEGILDKDQLIGKELPFFTLPADSGQLYSSDLLGKPTIVSFLTSWSPLASEQLTVLNSLPQQKIRVVGVFLQETQSQVALFAKRGAYILDVWVDEDGDLIEKFNLHTVPTHLFLDSRGVVSDVYVGYLHAGELLKRL